MAAKRIAVMGAGIAGLCIALELQDSGYEVVLIERDAPPPDIAPQDAFEQWTRPGVPQFRHAHIFLARMCSALRDKHPSLVQELLDAGFEYSTLEELLPQGVASQVTAQPGDEDLVHLWGRRPTFEYVLRCHVERLPHVRFMHHTQVTGLLTEGTGKQLRATGLSLLREDQHETLQADIVVDASGKHSKSPEWLRELGLDVSHMSDDSDFLYTCRHYRLKDPAASPKRLDGGGNLDYLGYSLFYEEGGYYALTFGCPVYEKELSSTIVHAKSFEVLAQQFPVIKRWVDASDAKTKVLGAGDFKNGWTQFGKPGSELLNFFPVGDCHVQTNPMYGRGCSFAYLQAQTLAETLKLQDARQRARVYEQQCRRILTPYVKMSTDTDRMYHMRAKLSRGEQVPLGQRIFNYLYEAAWLPAIHSDMVVAREFVKAVQMREISPLGVRVQMVFRILRALMRTWLGHRVPQAKSPPPRDAFLKQLASATPRTES